MKIELPQYILLKVLDDSAREVEVIEVVDVGIVIREALNHPRRRSLVPWARVEWIDWTIRDDRSAPLQSKYAPRNYGTPPS